MLRHRWPVRVTCDAGSHRLSRTVDGAGDIYGAALRAIRARSDRWRFLGCTVRMLTPLGQRVDAVYDGAWGEDWLDAVIQGPAGERSERFR